MPELPEVESIRQSLLPVVTGREIRQVEILTPGVFISGCLPTVGWRITSLDRRGKYLFFLLEKPPGLSAKLVVHLRMTGRLLLQDSDIPVAKHTHVRIKLGPASGIAQEPPLWLVYHDPRRFGRLWLLQDDPAGGKDGPAGLKKLGPEPLDPAFDPDLLASRLNRRPRTSLKAALLDQSVVAGLGNIYTDEILFASGLHPARQAGFLSSQELAELTAAIRQVITRAIACRGTTLRDYVNGWNQKGTFQNCLMVYGRAGQPCRLCGQQISRTRLSGRTTCWCPTCQPEKF
jgi:formamidopyrimidine-DNA glycosylase